MLEDLGDECRFIYRGDNTHLPCTARAGLCEWRPLAEKGNVDAQTYLGFMYANGRGIPQDYATTVKWFRLAAEQAFAAAQTSLGMMYGRGPGVPQDDAEAMKWLSAAYPFFMRD